MEEDFTPHEVTSSVGLRKFVVISDADAGKFLVGVSKVAKSQSKVKQEGCGSTRVTR